MKTISLFKSSFWISSSTFITRFFALASNLVLARLLLPSDFGVIGIAYIFWSLFTLFTQDTTGSFILYKGTEDKRYLNTTYTISVAIGLTFAILMSLSAPGIARFFNEPNLTWILVLYAFNILMSSVYYVYIKIMTRQMQYRELAQITLIGSFTRLLFTIVSALLGFRYWSFAIGDSAFWILGCILSRYKSGQNLKLKIDATVKSEVLSYTLAATGSNIGFYINANSDNFFVGKLLGNTSLGYYNLAYQLTMALSTIFNSVIAQLGTPIFANLEDKEEQENALFKVVKHTAFITAPIYALFFILINENFISLVFSPKWATISIVIPWLLVFAYFRNINSPLHAMLCAKGRPDINARVNLYIAPIAVLGFIIGAHYGSIYGVSIAVACVLGIIWTVYWWWFAGQKIGLSIMSFLRICFTPFIMAIVIILMTLSLPLLIKPIAFTIIYIIFLRLLFPLLLYKYIKMATYFSSKIIFTRANKVS